MPPKGSRKSVGTTPNKTLVLDNGAYTIKAGHVFLSTDPSYEDCAVIPNCIARSTRDKRTYIGSELEICKDFGELTFRWPVEKGFIVNWEAEKAIWEREFINTSVTEKLKVGRRGARLTVMICSHFKVRSHRDQFTSHGKAELS